MFNPRDQDFSDCEKQKKAIQMELLTIHREWESDSHLGTRKKNHQQNKK